MAVLKHVKLDNQREMDPLITTKVEDQNKVDASTLDIIRSIHWPKLTIALRCALYCMLASAIIGSILYLYDFGINEIIAHFV